MMWAQEGGVPSVSESHPKILQPRSFHNLRRDVWDMLTKAVLCIYFRPYKETGYFGDDDIYHAIYLREQTAKSFARQICKKSSIDDTRVKEMMTLNFLS